MSSSPNTDDLELVTIYTSYKGFYKFSPYVQTDQKVIVGLTT